MTDHYAPTIHVEPPVDEQALYFPSGMYNDNNNNYCGSSGLDLTFNLGGGYPPMQSFDSELSPSAELSPLEDLPFLQTNYRYTSPSDNSGRSSPIDFSSWSPASSFSGDISPDEFSPSWHQQGFSGHSSPALSPSLSPITSALDNFAFDDEHYPASEVLPSAPISRLRSSSHSALNVSPAELWVDGVGRGRSSSFSGPTVDTQFYHNDAIQQQQQEDFTQYQYSNSAEVQISVADAETNYDSFGTNATWGTESQQGSDAAADNMATLGGLTSGWVCPVGQSSAEERAPPSPSLLTVPTVGLQRRPACSSRRSRSHSDLSSIVPGQDLGRGRGQHRSTLSIPNSRSVSNGSRASSREASPHGAVFFNDVQTPASFSPNSPSPSSSAFEDAETGDEGISVGRRRTFTAIRGSDERLTPGLTLSRASSAPTRGRRAKPVPNPLSGRGMFSVKVEASTPYLTTDGGDGSQQEFRVAQPPTAPAFKAEVASKKIRQASTKRRMNEAAFACPLPSCSSTFTARHNLINHINSHNKHRPYRCSLCTMAFTTQGVLNRHLKRCSNK
ncbi:hypothetical protein DFH06DRAFT_1465343 [Mycena polygramma]|nr:hypothetical protein DFH06DRAFT_1465343 [Mycena polygramma]